MAQERRIPGAGQAGLIRYFDEEEAGIKIDPKHVVAAAIFLMFLVLVLRIYAG